MLGQLTLVTGGAASGKSAYAEALAYAQHPARLYTATSEARDAEMKAKIAAHRARRGSGWDTLEAPLDLAPALARVAPGRVVLVDCATMWLSNRVARRPHIAPASEALIEALHGCAAPVLVVTNELGQGVVPNNPTARAFRQVHGEMNQRLAAEADLVVAVMSGLPFALKGTLPEIGS
ncbi:MAG TPA: bifunctional adenosylcobinamide kinase/adenosylcobinamide-phosphate guanylyltransferase [Aliiroseovarius sp.]|nr:bifunctional adenosylcobinamide kinase/adenosylcobinamide-phosphate guanylyltransferase [Aliiroseovarius sp.]